MTAADNEELDAIEELLGFQSTNYAYDARRAIQSLRARVAELEQHPWRTALEGTVEKMGAKLESAESQLRQVKADAERWQAFVAHAKKHGWVRIGGMQHQGAYGSDTELGVDFIGGGIVPDALTAAIDAARRNDGTT